MSGENKFNLIIGGTAHQVKVNKVSIEVVSDAVTPLPIDVRVFEEDTHLVLTVDPVMRYTEEHPIRLMTSIMEEKPRKPGAVVRKNSSWYAVVHDLDAEPICREEWIDTAYGGCLQLAEKSGVIRLGLPLLGAVHSSFPAQESLQILVKHLRSQNFSKLKKIVLLVEKGFEEQVGRMLKMSR